MIVKVKKLHPKAKIPKYAKPGDAGMDLYCTEIIWTYDYIQYNTGLAFEVPEGYFGLLVPRSSNTTKDLILKNSAGILDSGYRGEVSFRYKPLEYSIYKYNEDRERLGSLIYKEGDRIGQILILPYPTIDFEEVEKLSETERGVNGYGSTGR